MKTTKTRTTIAAAFAVLVLGACGSSKSSMGSHDMSAMGSDSSAPATTVAAKPASSAAAAAGAMFKDADVTFAQGMIPHHEQAIEMADMALDPGAGGGGAIKALATKIKAGQDPEIKQLKALLTAWGKPLAMDTAGHDMASMDGMMSAKDMTGLGAMKGAGFDKMWAAMMISHHKGAITMAQAVKAGGSNPDVLKLADAIITAQQAEIGQLTPLAA